MFPPHLEADVRRLVLWISASPSSPSARRKRLDNSYRFSITHPTLRLHSLQTSQHLLRREGHIFARRISAAQSDTKEELHVIRVRRGCRPQD